MEAYDLLVQCFYESGNKEKCASYAVTYLKYNKYQMAVLSRLLKTLLSDMGLGDGQECEAAYLAVLQFVAKLYDFSSLKDRLFLVKTAQMSECSDFAQYGLNSLFTVEERKQIGI